MPKTLHRQEGLKIVQNDKNGFVVATLLFTADPRKRDPRWIKEASRGMSEAQVQQEYYISYDAMLGEKVFPELKSKASEIILHDGPYQFNDWPRDLPMWAGLDYGARNPSAFIVFTAVDGILYAIWELYEPCKDINVFVAKMKGCPYWDQIRYIAHDPSMNNLTQRDMRTGGMTTVARCFIDLGVTKLLAGNTNEAAWLVSMQKHWSGEEVTFKIMDSCPKLIEEFEAATYVTMTERSLETSNFKEQMVDKFNHALDATKYFMNSSPSLKSRKINLPNLASKFGFGSVTSAPGRKLSSDKQWTFIR
jgi:hypothetical protein